MTNMQSQNINTIRPKGGPEKPVKVSEKPEVSKEVVSTKEVVSGTVEGLTEGIEVATGQVVEKETRVAESKAGAAPVTQRTAAVTREIPTPEVMVTEIITEVENEIIELTKLEHSIRANSEVDYSKLNEVVKRKRNLYGLIEALKNAASLAKDFIIGKWKELVLPKKAN